MLTGLLLLQSSLTPILPAENDKRIIGAVDTYGLRRLAEADVRSAVAIEVGKPLPCSPEELKRRLETVLSELIVMAHWESIYGMQPFLLLGRVAGISERRLKAVWADPVEREKPFAN